MENKELKQEEQMVAYIKKYFKEDIDNHNKATKENPTCPCNWETEGLCLIGRWENSCITSFEYLVEQEVFEEDVTIEQMINILK